ncbi:MAG: SAM-dependent methyltransferase [Phycisphaerales bacterium JB038]
MARQREQQDHYFREAKRLGYVSRAAFKLLEIDDKHKLITRGARVLDIGCAPGAWLQVLGQRVGKRGRVVGVDLKEVRLALPNHVQTLRGDVFEMPAEEMTSAAGGAFDAVVSDAAPDTTGDPQGDHFRSSNLCNQVLDLLPELLLPGGPVVMKVFEGETYPDLLTRMGGVFERVKGVKPKASRSVSREMFVVGWGFQPSGV